MPPRLRVYLQTPTQRLVQRLHQPLPPTRIQATHFVQVPGKVPLVEKGRDGRLQQVRAVVVQTIRLAGERWGLFGGYHQVGQTQAWKQDFAEGAGVEHAALLVEALEGRQGLALVAVFAVVVVLDDPAALAVGPVQQGQAPRQGQRHPQRALVGRGDHGKTGLWGAGDALGDVQTLIVHGHRHQLRAGFQQRVPGHEVAGLFQPASGARAHQRVADQVEAGAVAGADENLLRVAADAPGNPQVGGNGRTQRGVAARVRVDQAFDARLAQLPAREAGPELARKGVQRWQAHLQGQGRGAGMDGLVGRGGHWGALRGRRNRCQLRRDNGPGGPASSQVTLAYQQLVGRFHGAPRQVEFRRQGANRRHSVPRTQAAIGDRLAKPLIKLAIDRRRLAAVQFERKDHGLVIYAFFGL